VWLNDRRVVMMIDMMAIVRSEMLMDEMMDEIREDELTDEWEQALWMEETYNDALRGKEEAGPILGTPDRVRLRPPIARTPDR
jgi:hypothetical protein